MAYYGTTAASSVSNPPRKVIDGVAQLGMSTGLTTAPAVPGGQGGSLWMYCSTNLTTDINAAGFFSDGKALGMRPGDFVMASQFSSAGSTVTLYLGVVSQITTAGAASLSTGGSMTSS